MRVRKAVSLLVAMIVSTFILTGCADNTSDSDERFNGKSREDIKQLYLGLADEYTKLYNQYNDLQAVYGGIQSESIPSAAIGVAGDGSGRFTFYSVDSKIIFPSTFEYPGSTQNPSDGSVSIVNGVSIEPGSNWVLKTGTATLELEHTSGISGTIKVGRQSFLYSAESLQNDVLAPWFKGLPPSDVTYSTINVNGANAYGCQATTPTLIDSESAYLRCGMLGNSVGEGEGKCITYIFVYRGSKDPTKDEAIANLLNTIKIDGATVLVEQ